MIWKRNKECEDNIEPVKGINKHRMNQFRIQPTFCD